MSIDHDRARELQARADARVKADEFHEAVEFRLRLGDEAIRQNALLRQTVARRLVDLDPQTPYSFGLKDAYEDVQTLLGPEDAWYTDDDGNPF